MRGFGNLFFFKKITINCRISKQIEEAEEIAALNLAKFRKAQQELEQSEERADLSEQVHGEENNKFDFEIYFTKHFFGLPPYTKCREFFRGEFPLHMCLRGFFIFFL